MSLKNSQKAVLHVAKNQLGLDDEAYRAALLAHGGVDSSKDLDLDGFKAVMKHFESCGFKSRGGLYKPSRTASSQTRPYIKPPKMGPGMASDKEVRKIIAMWLDPQMKGYYREGQEERALSGFLLKTCGVSKLEWLTPKMARNAIEALKDIQTRRGGSRTAHTDAGHARAGEM